MLHWQLFEIKNLNITENIINIKYKVNKIFYFSKCLFESK